MKDQASQSHVIRTPEHRLRVFVSSTLKELAKERLAIRQAIVRLRLTPVMFESGARPHPAQTLYRAYLSQSHIFIGLYWQSYGWTAPGMLVSGLEDEYNLSVHLPRLLYIKDPAPDREPSLARLIDRMQNESSSCYKRFSSTEELEELVENDLALILTEHFESSHCEPDKPREPSSLPRSSVPTPRNKLIGRERELLMAKEMLRRDDIALVTLTGAGGIGKSRLGIQVALELQDQFPDGIYLVGLEALTDPELVIPTLARALGIAETAGPGPLSEMLKGLLHEKQVLLVLDNFEQVLAAASQVADLMESCPRTKFLITSRAPLHLRAERQLLIPPLTVPPIGDGLTPEMLQKYPAVQLFTERTRSVKPDFEVTPTNAMAVAQICDRLEGLPLAIELASARSRMLSPQALLVRLQDRFKLLRGERRDLPERQQTMYSAIDWSHSLLSDDEKRLFRRLAVFSGGWSFDDADAVCNSEDEEPRPVFEGLEKLVEHSLVRPPEEVGGELRFSMFETIREFARERLGQSGDLDATEQQHAKHYLSLAETAEVELQGPARKSWGSRLDAEIDNLRAAMRWGLDGHENEISLRIATSLWLFWWTHGYWQEGLQWLERGICDREQIPVALKARGLALAGGLARELGDYAKGTPLLKESLALWRQIGDQKGIAMALSNLGPMLLRQGDYSGATAMLEEALGVRRQLPERRGLIATLMNLAITLSEQGEHARAVDLYREALNLARTAGDDDQVALVLANFARTEIGQGHLNEAEALYAEAAPIFERLGNRAWLAFVSQGRGIVAIKRGHRARALDLFSEALTRFHESGVRLYAIACMGWLAGVAEEQGQLERAVSLLSASESLRKKLGVARPRIDQLEFESRLKDLKDKMDKDALAARWADAEMMTYEQAIGYAMKKEMVDQHPIRANVG